MRVMACDLVVQVAEDSLNGIRFGTVTRQPEQDKTRVARQPVADIPGGVNTIVIHHNIHMLKARSGIGAIQSPEQI